ncbi:SIS domain-containing protein [Tropicimonas isoalkanivorans]|uniref:Glutamine--fructose-6-phosphate transaminase n=1 Tax=Tropicimonas isoalkanivorans TaxID=441112 RepID=A0A1I1PI22_9RHOB|nr:SIS domain-containing protein [Tropicimonas isoalkanivorans]SFD09455.1 glutamine--fructose-6-phosphate transaminase [Tropicimonas isoalkanivorans]
MEHHETQMRREIREIPAAVERLLSRGRLPIEDAARAAAARDPAFAITIARGSSDHVCTYLKYVSELLLGLPVASVGPSIASIYGAHLRLQKSLCIAVSQSGKSPDIVELARAARFDGALSLAITNNRHSPLAESCSHTLEICAGPERSVAATKTFVTSIVAGLLLLAEWKKDADLRKALEHLPDLLDGAAAIDWPEVRANLDGRHSLFTLGRGPAWAISNEAALKFKETCQLHAESYSSAEVLHGPVSIVGEGFPVICFAAEDAAEKAVNEIADQIAAKGARVFVTSPKVSKATAVDHVRTGHPLTDPISLIVSFYSMVERFAVDHGIDPDTPRHLKKVTETI